MADGRAVTGRVHRIGCTWVGVALLGLALAAPWPVSAQSSTPTAPPPTGAKPNAVNLGTGFVISEQGHVLTAHHVIKDKAQVLVGPIEGDKWRVAQVVKVDEAKDLALLKARLDRPALALAEWTSVPQGLETLVIGYPQPRVQGFSKKITAGIFNGERHQTAFSHNFQLSAEIQQGNSGGPVFAPDGTVMGLITQKLNAQAVAEKTGDFAQNVNYAVKSQHLVEFVQSAGVPLKSRAVNTQVNLRPYELFARVESAVLAVAARNPPPKASANTSKPADDGDTAAP